MKGIAVFFALTLGVATVALGQVTPPATVKSVDCIKGNAPQETFEVKGLASDSESPIANATVIAFPFVLPENQPVTRFWLNDIVLVKDAGRVQGTFVYRTKNEGSATMENPRAQTDNAGAFTLKVSKGIFLFPCGCRNCSGYRPGELALGVFTESGLGRWQSMRELVTVKVDISTVNEVGELTFKPAGPDK